MYTGMCISVNLPDMWERTLTIGSAGKIFNATGLRTGWTIGPKHLIKACQIMLENCVSSSPTLIQVNNPFVLYELR